MDEFNDVAAVELDAEFPQTKAYISRSRRSVIIQQGRDVVALSVTDVRNLREWLERADRASEKP